MRFQYRTNLRIGGDEWTNHRVEAWKLEEKVGHITIAFIERDTFDELFPTVDEYAIRIRGIQHPNDNDRSILYPFYRRFEEFHVETAHVAYVLVEEGHRRQGIAQKLYVEGARWIGQHHGLKMAASDLQAVAIPSLWAKLVVNPDIPTVKLNDGRWALDFCHDHVG